MRAIVIYESMFGDGQLVAQAIAEGLRTAGVEAQPAEVGSAPTDVSAEFDLLVVGSPNHGWGMPREATRRDAATKSDRPLISQGIGVREWLGAAKVPAGIRTAAYDTRACHPKAVTAFDHASTQIEKGLSQLGGNALTRAEHFLVRGQTGPLEPGELDRARAWGEQLAATLLGVAT